MSEKLSKAQLEFLKKTSAAGAGGEIVSALLSHIKAMESETQRGERQAFVAGAEWLFGREHDEGEASEYYDVSAEADQRYPAARPMPETYGTILDSLCSDCKMRLRGILPETDDKQKRPIPTRENVVKIVSALVGKRVSWLDLEDVIEKILALNKPSANVDAEHKTLAQAQRPQVAREQIRQMVIDIVREHVYISWQDSQPMADKIMALLGGQNA